MTSAATRKTIRAVNAQRKQTGRSAGGGLHVLVHETPAGKLTVKKIDTAKLQPGKRLHGCIHHVGGGQRAALTALRRKRVRDEHARTVDPATGKCRCHVGRWKAKAKECGSI